MEIISSRVTIDHSELQSYDIEIPTIEQFGHEITRIYLSPPLREDTPNRDVIDNIVGSFFLASACLVTGLWANLLYHRRRR